MAEELLLALSTFPDAETARRIAQQLVTENLAACANIIPAVESIYRWQDKIENSAETFVFFKTTAERYGAFQEKLKSLHPYEVPEIICLRIADGLPQYLRWVIAGCSPG
jgi:periplasmic divalent cation tolerance protein